MSDVTGSTSLGSGVSLGWDYNGSATSPELTVSLKYHGISFASATLTENDASASIGGSVPATSITAKGTVTANWSTDTLSYDIVLSDKVDGFGNSTTYKSSTKF